MMVTALGRRPAVIAPFVTRPTETIIDRAARGLAPAAEAVTGVYALRAADPTRRRDGTVVLQGSGVGYAFVEEALPLIDNAGLNLHVLYIASAELFDLLPREQQERIFPAALADEAIADYVGATARIRPSAPSGYSASVLDADIDVRRDIYDVAVRSGHVPTREDCARALGRSIESIAASLQRLHDAHQIVLAAGGEILMAMPFSAVPTPFEVRGDGYRSYATCGWDALGIAAMLRRDVTISTSCPDCGDPLTLTVARERGVTRGEARLHFALPVRRWWESVVFT